ncbi:hypothetical protein FH972_000401 [Carpinus fangiana]|uniref:Polyphenol oxidase C-terminal domain-containing protein n=1 Tax=Carpinus fangiana TaxID=176857 RepID=A0A5N6Q8Z7_9ROSI|nr:hypothetical protein FH972_000401 [Carpinus fangiana]
MRENLWRMGMRMRFSRILNLGHGDVALAAETSPSVKFPVVLDKTISTVVIGGIEFDEKRRMTRKKYCGPNKSEFAGSFVNVPHKHKHGKKLNTILRLGISDLLEDLDAEDDDTVVVTLVPRYGKGLPPLVGSRLSFFLELSAFNDNN